MMKKSNLIKVFSILAISLVLILFTTAVNAADDGYENAQGLLGNNTSSNRSNNSSNTSNRANNTSNTNRTNNTSNNSSNTNRTNNTANNSSYNNSNLPKTGIESSIPVAMLIVVFAISSVYAYKKINDYKDI